MFRAAVTCKTAALTSSSRNIARLQITQQQRFATTKYEELFQLDPSNNSSSFPTPYRLVTKDHVKTVTVKDESTGETRQILKIEPEAIQKLTEAAMSDIQYLLRPRHLKQLSKILGDSEASKNDKFVARTLLKNAVIASGRKLPGCQDTGTAIVVGKRGQNVWTNGNDEAAISSGVSKTYVEQYLRYSQVAPLTMFEEKNTGTNLPAQIELYATDGDEYKFLFMAKGGGSANKTFLFQQTKALLNPDSLMKFLEKEIKYIGTSACPPYHLAIVIGGLSAEMNLKTVKMASAKYYDDLPTSGDASGRAFRDLEYEQKVLELTQKIGIGAQFGGKYFCHDVRVIRLPRHGASCPVGLGVSCSADRQAMGKITKDGVFLEQLETDPAQYLPEINEADLGDDVVKVDLNQPIQDILKTLSQYPIKTRLSLSGPLIVARDIAHAKLKERLDKGEGLPDHIKNHIIYYAGPAKTPEGYASGSFGPTTSSRMDSYIDLLQKNGGSMISLAKGNRSKEVTKACKENGGFYLGSVGGPGAILAQTNIKKVEVVDYPELGMEAIWRIEVEDFPAFIVIDDKGNDFFEEFLGK